MKNRRNFLRQLKTLSLGLTPLPFFQSVQGQDLLKAIKDKHSLSIDRLTTDEDFWQLIKQAYTVSPTLLNLNNGGVSPQPKVVQDAVERYNKLSNEAPSFHMWRTLDQGREPLRSKLANLAGCSAEELAINRNTSEALETVIFGLRLKEGDEVVLSKQDYPNMRNAWKQRAIRDGIQLKWLNINYPSEDKNYLIKQYVSAFTENTKVVHLTHMLNWNGQILPVAEIASEAQKRGIEVIVDAAHTFAHLVYTIPSLHCDYWGSSLHKWLGAPFGTGLLYVKKEKIKNLYPLFAAPDPEQDNIRKFENLVPEVQLLTSLHSDFGGAIALIAIDGQKPEKTARILHGKYKIHTTSSKTDNIYGVRITPNVYTSIRDLDRLVVAIQEIAKDIRK